MPDRAFEKAASIPMLKTLGISLLEASPRHAVMEVVVSEKHANFYGGTHGGLLATLADTACFFPLPLIPSGKQVTTVSLNLDYMRPVAIGEHVRARADLVRLGRRTVNLNITITNDAGKPVVQGTAMLLVMEENGGAGSSAD